MQPLRIQQKRINSISFLEKYDIYQIQLGIPVKNREPERVGLEKIGDVVLPAASFGIQSRRNAYGFCYADKSKPKESRIVSTNWIYPYGNKNASKIAVDIRRDCYPIVEEPPYGIELCLTNDQNGDCYIICVLNNEIRANHIKEALNLMLEIFGFCYIYDKEIQNTNKMSIRRCNWEILPPGEMPSRIIERQFRERGLDEDRFDVARLKKLEMYSAVEIVEGICGFKGYYAFVFRDYCVLESITVGNATYIIPSDNWEARSQMTKQELLYENLVIKRIVHKKMWKAEIGELLERLGIVPR